MAIVALLMVIYTRLYYSDEVLYGITLPVVIETAIYALVWTTKPSMECLSLAMAVIIWICFISLIVVIVMVAVVYDDYLFYFMVLYVISFACSLTLFVMLAVKLSSKSSNTGNSDDN